MAGTNDPPPAAWHDLMGSAWTGYLVFNALLFGALLMAIVSQLVVALDLCGGNSSHRRVKASSLKAILLSLLAAACFSEPGGRVYSRV